jgi:ribosome biogenesis GTPase A
MGEDIILIGLDNAGKSSLFNRIVQSGTLPIGTIPETTPTIGMVNILCPDS